MNIIFLDMDGVVNSAETFKKAKTDKEFLSLCIEERGRPYLIDPELRDKINEIIIGVDDCKIVWSSTWRMGLRNSKSFIEGFYNKCNFVKDSFLSYTPIRGSKRYEEILEWLIIFGNNYHIDKCVIIDDSVAYYKFKELEKLYGKDSEYYKIAKKYNPKFFQTNWEKGITEEIKLKILNYFV